MSNKKVTIILIIFVLIILALVGIISYSFFYARSLNDKNISVGSCVATEEEKIVRGNSLEPIFKDGQAIKVLSGYYNCNEVKRGDIIVYNYAGNNPIIKIVKGVPGDTFSLKKEEDHWLLVINGEISKNSENEPYKLGASTNKLLSLYVRDYKGVIPGNAYIILGNILNGSVDSTRFGLVDKSDILGKVIF